MSPDANLFAYRGRGRPNARSSKLSISTFLQNELRRLRTQMAYKKGAEILLAVSAASDEMVRAVHMFPEVFYMDTTAKTNRQNCDFFNGREEQKRQDVHRQRHGGAFLGRFQTYPSHKNRPSVFTLIERYDRYHNPIFGKSP